MAAADWHEAGNSTSVSWPARLRSLVTPRLSPMARRQWSRFREIKRGYYSAVLLLTLLIFSLVAELFINSRALMVSYEGRWYFPTYGDVLPGTTFGQDYQYETNYRQLAARFDAADNDNWVVLAPVPYGPLETDLDGGGFPPFAPGAAHWLGTDTTGRDVLARLVYGFRLAMGFSLLLLLFNFGIGIALGCAMGFWGGLFDLVFQRIIEIWNNVPYLYVIMIVASIMVPTFWTLLAVMIVFGWTGMTWYLRTATYREKARDYVMAAKAIGASNLHIIFRHILPNALSIVITFVPFSVAGGITALTALDYLGFGLPAPTPSWGELLAQGTDNLDYPWIVASVVGGLSLILLMVTFIGEAIREAFDPRKFSYYE